MSRYRLTYEGPNLLEALLEILFSLVLTYAVVWLGEEVFDWGEIGRWEFAILYLAIYVPTRIRFR